MFSGIQRFYLQMLVSLAAYMSEQRQRSSRSSGAAPAQLLFIVGDGRNVDSRGRQALLAALQVCGFSEMKYCNL